MLVPMTHSRRVIVSIALGAGLAILANAVARLLTDDPDGGWFMYAPGQTDTTFEPSDGDTVLTAVVWLIAVGVWSAVSWRLFMRRDHPTS